MYNFKIILIILLILLLIYIYIFKKKEFFLPANNILINDTRQGKSSQNNEIIIRIAYRNNCNITKKFMYGCCEKNLSEYEIEYDAEPKSFLKYFTKPTNTNAISEKHKFYDKNKLDEGNNVFITRLKKKNGINDEVKSTIKPIDANKIQNSFCADVKDFYDENNNYICKIENDIPIFKLLTLYLSNINDQNKGVHFHFEFIEAPLNVTVPNLSIFKTSLNQSKIDIDLDSRINYYGNINNLCNLIYFINETLVIYENEALENKNPIGKLDLSKLNKIILDYYKKSNNNKRTEIILKGKTEDKLKIYSNEFIKYFNKFKCIPGELFVHSKTKSILNNEIELRKFNDSFITNRPKIIIENLLNTKDYIYTLLIIEHKYLKEHYRYTSSAKDNVLYWIIWGNDISNTLSNNETLFLKGLEKDDDEKSELIKTANKLYDYLIINENDLQLTNEYSLLPGTNKVELNKLGGLSKYIDLNFKFYLLNKLQNDTLTDIFKKFNTNQSILYDKLLTQIDLFKNINTVDINTKLYNEEKKELRLLYSIKKEQKLNIDRYKKYYDLKHKNLVFSLYSYPYRYYKLIRGNNTINIPEDGYYELILIKPQTSLINLTIEKKKYLFGINSVNKIYIPKFREKGNKIIINSDTDAEIIFRKSSYIIKKFIDKPDNTGKFIFKITKPSQFDILIYFSSKDNKIVTMKGYDDDKNKLYKLNDKHGLLIIRNNNLKTTEFENLIKYSDFDKNKMIILSSSIIFYKTDNSILNYDLTNSTNTFNKLNYIKNKRWYLLHKKIKTNLIYFNDKTQLYLDSDNNNLINLADNTNKTKVIINKSIEFFNIGPDYIVSEDEIINLGKKRINKVEIDDYCVINRNLPTLRLELSEINTNNTFNTLKFNNTKINKKYRGVIKIYKTDEIKTINDKNLIYVQWDLKIINNINYLLFDQDNGNNTIYNLDLDNIKYETINLVIKFEIYNPKSLIETEKKNIYDKLYSKTYSEFKNYLNNLTITDSNKNTLYSNILNKYIITTSSSPAISENDGVMKKSIDNNFLMMLNSFINKDNIIEYTNYSSFGPLTMKQNITMITYKVNNGLNKCEFEEIELFDQNKYDKSFLVPDITRGPITTNIQLAMEKTRIRQEKKQKKEKTLQEVIDTYKKNIFHFYGN